MSDNPKRPKTDQTAAAASRSDHQMYRDFFKQVYETMQQNYYHPVAQEEYDRFLKTFEEKIYSQLMSEGKSNDYVRWRSAAYLVDSLKSKEDIFSAFYPPEPAKEYEQTVLGKKVDIGVEGKLTGEGFVLTQVEPRSDAYQKGLRVRDIIKKVDKQDVIGLTEEKVIELLTSFEGDTVEIVFLDVRNNMEQTVSIASGEYFKQTVFMTPVPVKGVYCLEIRRFNRKTAEDMYNYINFIHDQKDNIGLILDLRGNPGGPPLAAREISSFFLPAGEEFAYFQRRDKPKAALDIPRISKRFHYKEPIVILVNEKSGSASELFSGIMQDRKRAVLMGQNTAGQVFLKSMFNFDDQSMLLLVTARGYYPSGKVFNFSGVKPDRFVKKEEEDSLLRYAANYIVYLKGQDASSLPLEPKNP